MARFADLVGLFEQSAAERDQAAFLKKSEIAIAPIGRFITNDEIDAMHASRLAYEREDARHKMWLERRHLLNR